VEVRLDSPISRVGSALLVALLLTVTLREFRSLGNSAPDFACSQSSSKEVTVEVKSGETGSSIARQLFSKGVTKSSEAFFRVAVSDPRAAQIAPGAHRLNKGLCAKEALTQLLDSKRLSGLINIVEGAWISEVIPQMYKAGFTAKEVSEALRSVEKPKGFTSLEGLLFPAQYSFARGTSAQSAISSMVKNSQRAMQEADFFSSGSKYSPQQLLVIASLLQAEGKSQDFRKISQVIQNRLRIGMPLQFDSTVHYVKKVRGNIFLSTQSTLISSPYNTYRKYGLPPGPINNPGLAAMRAAMNPKAGNWIYFITVAPSDTRFTADIDEFNRWKVEYKKNLRAGLFGSSR
jgi:UPF0755 protein